MFNEIKSSDMTKSEINRAFENRWRFKGEPLDFIPDVKELCRDFFEAGILLGEGFQVAEIFDDEGKPTGQTVIYKHDPIFDTADSGFSEWWDMYGKKIDRAKCFKKWQKMTDAERRACIAATPAYVASTPDLQYRRHPATYLNNKSWENQIIPRNNGTDKQAQQQRFAKVAERIAEYTKDAE